MLLTTKQSVKGNLQQLVKKMRGSSTTTSTKKKQQVSESKQVVCDNGELQEGDVAVVNHDDDDDDDIASTEVESASSSSEGQDDEDEEDQEAQPATLSTASTNKKRRQRHHRFRVHFNLHLNDIVEAETTINDADIKKLWWRKTDYQEFQYNCLVVASKEVQTTAVASALLYNLYTTMSISSTPDDARNDKKDNRIVDEDKQQEEEEASHHNHHTNENDEDYCEKILNYYTSTDVERDNLLELCRSDDVGGGRGIESYLYPNIVQERRAYVRSVLSTQRLLKLESCMNRKTTTSPSLSWKKTKNMMMSLRRRRRRTTTTESDRIDHVVVSSSTSSKNKKTKQQQQLEDKILMRNIIIQEHLATVSQNLSYRSKHMAIIMGSVDAIIAREVHQQ